MGIVCRCCRVGESAGRLQGSGGVEIAGAAAAGVGVVLECAGGSGSGCGCG